MIFEIVLFVGSIILYRIYTELEKRKASGIKYLPYQFPFGHLQKVIFREKSFGLAMNDFYSGTKERVLGIYLIFKQAILVCDPEIVKMIQTTHIEHFSDRGICPDKKKDPLAANLFSIEYDEWKPLRAKLTPAFSPAKMKKMMRQIQDISLNYQHLINESFGDEIVKNVQIKDHSTRYATDIIASTIFGIEVNSVSDEDHPFRGLGKRMSQERETKIIESIRLMCTILFPKLSRYLGMENLPRYISDYFIKLVRETFETRERTKEVRYDVMQQLLQLRNTGSLESDTWTSEKSAGNTNFLSIEECASNAFLFYIAGSESSSSTICYCLFELSREPEYLQTLLDEIDRMLANYKEDITYEALNDMPFLEKCITETLRKYPALPMLNRRCTKDFQVPGTNQFIYKDQPIIIPLRAIQTDPKYFPNPLKFNPNRTDPNDPDYSGMPTYAFGEGPKSCIAFRLGKIMVKMGLIAILSKFTVEKGQTEELNYPIGNLGMPPSNDFTIKLSKRREGQVYSVQSK